MPPAALNCLAKALTSSSAYRLPSCIVATLAAWTLCAYLTAAAAPLMSLYTKRTMPWRPMGRSGAVKAGAVALVTACGIPAFHRMGEPPRDSEEQAVPSTPTICLLDASRVAPVWPPSTLHCPSSGRYLMGWPTSVLPWSSNAISAPRDASTPSDRSGPDSTSSAPIRMGWPLATLTTPTSSVTGPSVSALAAAPRIVAARQPAAAPRRTARRRAIVILRQLPVGTRSGFGSRNFASSVPGNLNPPPGSPAACGPCTPCGTARGAAIPAPAGPRWRGGRPAGTRCAPA